MTDLTPIEIVKELDKYIIGQDDAKRSVAIALRNRWRRLRLDSNIRNEVTPKNILMIGPTGVGKTEIARRIAKLAYAPFVKVEATKFTEVGYVGRDVESIIRDLADVSIKETREKAIDEIKHEADNTAMERVLDILLPTARTMTNEDEQHSQTRNKFKQMILEGKLDNKEVDIEIKPSQIGVEVITPPGMEEISSQLQGMFQNITGDKKQTRTLPLKQALKALSEDIATDLVNQDEIKYQAIENVEQNGIVFLDELDKVAKRSEGHGSDISREGVQRDLLPLVEGCNVSTRYGMIKTDHILFIASGAFHFAKPSDLIPELQGRLPIRVELDSLDAKDFIRILTEPNASLTEQYTKLLAVEGVVLEFEQDGIEEIANIAWKVNDSSENIGARRLHTVMERLLESVSFEASELSGQKIIINDTYVKQRLDVLIEDQNLSQYIL